MRGRARWIVVVAAMVGCTSKASTSQEAPSESAANDPSGRTLASVARAFPHAPPRDALLARGDVFVRADARAWQLNAALPARADGPQRFTIAGDSAHFIEIRALELAPAKASLEDDALLYADVAPSTDLVLTAGRESMEELRVLHDARAPRTMRWSVTGTGLDETSALHARTSEDGHIEIVDAKGGVLLASAPFVAVDAKGERRTMTTHAEGSMFSATLDANGLTYPIVVDPLWVRTPDPTSGIARWNPYVVLIGNGRVLVGGGTAPYMDLYDPTTNSWPFRPPDYPLAGWTDARAASLPSGDVLVIPGNGTLTDIAVYQYKTNNWATYSGRMSAACNLCAVSTLSDGRIVKVPAGGTVVEIFTPSTLAFTKVAALGATSYSEVHTVTLAGDRVLAVECNGTVARAELWTASTNTWTTLPAPSACTTDMSMTVLGDGRALLTGEANARLFDPTTLKWSLTSAPARARHKGTLVTLRSGHAVALGGIDTSGSTDLVEVYDPGLDTWTIVDHLAEVHNSFGAVRVADGSVLAVDGYTNTSTLWVGAIRYTPSALGVACALRSTCDSGFCADGVCCDSLCDKGTCNVAGKLGKCLLAAGQTCSASSNCLSGNCVDGVCCLTACTGACESCKLSGSVGACTPIVGDPTAAGRPACGGAGLGTTCGSTCNGVTRATCTFPTASTACGAGSCTSGVETRAGGCDGAGACTTTTAACGAFTCGASACKRSCVADGDCAAGNYCAGDKCAPLVGLGDACTETACNTGLFCVDGVCCGTSSCSSGSSCGLATDKGTCRKIAASTCTLDDECGSRHCVDGVCCDVACDGQCEACDVGGKEGTCSPVSGSPHGKRTTCDDGGADQCKALRCDGPTDRTKCTAFTNKSSVVCKKAACAGSALHPASTCDGLGACVSPPDVSCGRYACDDARGDCRVTCAADTHCAKGFVCVSGLCREATECDPTGNLAIAPDGTRAACAPYLCNSTTGKCRVDCSSSDQCFAGNVCDVATGHCTTPTTGNDSGCGVGPGNGKSDGGDGNGATWALSALSAIVMLGLRRRSARGGVR